MSSLRTRRKASTRSEWTPARIRAATPFPKPQGEISKARSAEYGEIVGPIESTERAMLRTIAETADLIDAGRPDSWNGGPRYWLLVPAPAELIEFLATFEADRAALEPDHDREPDCDDEEDKEGDDNEDREPDDDGGEGVGPAITEAGRERYRNRTGEWPRQEARRLLRVFQANGTDRGAR